jgi:DNA-directed RNA polymerase specialized sigma subunit
MEDLKLDPDASWHSWRANPSPDATGQLLKSLQPVMDKGLRQFSGGNAASPNMRSHAKLLTLTAARSFNPEQGNLQNHVMQHLQRLQRLSAASSLMKVPEQISNDFQRLSQHEAEFRDKFGRDPSDAETTNLTGLSQKRIARIRQVHLPVAEGQSVGDVVSNKYDDAATSAWIDYLYHDMSPTDQVIVDCTMGRNGATKLPVNQIAQRLGITSGAVSQRTSKIQQLIDSRHELSPF